jgi:transcriptional regulator with XRE-family HTH domain
MKVNYALIGLRIKENRQLKNLTQEELAELIEISPGFMSLIETGRKKPSLDTLLAICKELQITLNEILTGNQIPLDTDYCSDLSSIVAHCNEEEKRLIYDITKAVRDALINRREH